MKIYSLSVGESRLDPEGCPIRAAWSVRQELLSMAEDGVGAVGTVRCDMAIVASWRVERAGDGVKLVPAGKSNTLFAELPERARAALYAALDAAEDGEVQSVALLALWNDGRSAGTWGSK